MWGNTQSRVPNSDPPVQKSSDIPGDSHPASFKGRVRRYFADIKMGTVEDDNGQLYGFSRDQWLTQNVEPSAGQIVSYQLNGGRAVNLTLEV